MLKLLSHWNGSKENILFFTEYLGNIFVITVNTYSDIYKNDIIINDPMYKKNVHIEVNFRGYVFNKNSYSEYIKSIAFSRCLLHYYDDYTTYKTNYMYIDDIAVNREYRNKGYGSIVLEQIIQYAKQQEVKYVSGYLSFVDTSEQYGNRRDMLHHFYKKHGFIIDENDNLMLSL